MELPIILIGFHSTGESNVGKLLASHLQSPFIKSPDICEKYWQVAGYDENLLEQAWEDNQADGVYHYMMPFEAYAIERGISEHLQYVIEIGSLQSVYDDAELLKQVQRVLNRHKYRILVLPSPDVEESLEILKERERVIINEMEINEYFLKHPCNYSLAKYIIYTKDKTPEQTSEELLAQIDSNASDIILIGPEATGKSTIGRILASKLGLPQVSMDLIRWKYYKEVGWSPQEQRQIAENEGFPGVYRYWKQFDIYAVERLLQEHQNCVIDFGAGHSIYENDEDFVRSQEILASYTNVILLIPSPDLDESIAILKERKTLIINGMEANRFLLTHSSNHKLANFVVYTKGKTPSETRDEILELIKTDANSRS
ncbi:MAG: shikimate kinase [Cyanobacteria bacterium P01_A01_bin.84]